MPFYKENNIKIYFEPEFNGGGTSFGQLYVPIMRRLNIRANNCLEIFSGPAFIGFSLLAHGISNHLTVGDINERALDNVRKTVNLLCKFQFSSTDFKIVIGSLSFETLFQDSTEGKCGGLPTTKSNLFSTGILSNTSLL